MKKYLLIAGVLFFAVHVKAQTQHITHEQLMSQTGMVLFYPVSTRAGSDSLSIIRIPIGSVRTDTTMDKCKAMEDVFMRLPVPEIVKWKDDPELTKAWARYKKIMQTQNK